MAKQGKVRAVREMTLLDGTVVHEGDKVLAQGEVPGWRVALVLEIFKGCGVDKALLTAGEKYTGRRDGGATMSYQHNLALKYHCRFAFETAHPRFHFARRGLSCIITVNSGYE